MSRSTRSERPGPGAKIAGSTAERAAEHRDIARRNGERIIADPSVALDAITRQQSTFTDHDLMRFVHRHSDEPQQYAKALSAVRTSPELVALGRDGRGRERFTTREMMAVESKLEASAERLAERRGHGISAADRTQALSAADTVGLRLGQEQADAVGAYHGPRGSGAGGRLRGHRQVRDARRGP